MADSQREDTGNRDFAAALLMIDRLPLTDDEKANAIRRLMAGPVLE